MSNQSFDAMIEDAQRLGYGDVGRVINRLQRMIAANEEYLAYRQKRGRTGRYNEAVAEDTLALAMAVKLLSENAETP